MKLLFDENLSPKLPELLKGKFTGSRHVRECGLKGKTDREIWNYARSEGFSMFRKILIFYNAPSFMVRRQSLPG